MVSVWGSMRGGDTYPPYWRPIVSSGGLICVQNYAFRPQPSKGLTRTQCLLEFIGSVLPLPPHVIYYSMLDNI